MNSKDIKKIIRKFRVSSGNIIVVKGDPSDEAARSFVKEFAHEIERSTLRDIFVVLLDDPDKIAVFDTAIMNKHGWFRRDQMVSLFRKIGVQKEGAQEKDG